MFGMMIIDTPISKGREREYTHDYDWSKRYGNDRHRVDTTRSDSRGDDSDKLVKEGVTLRQEL